MSGRTVERPEDLREILSIPFSDEQLAVIAAPLEPGVVIAAAGSGKTTVMAARVVWLVGTGQVRADQVLGLTFTRKAAAELSNRVTTALSGSGIIDAAALENSEAQTVTTYDSFAGQLVSEHAPRIGIDPAEHRLTDATRYRLAAQVVAANEFPLVEWNDRRLIGALLGLDTMMTQHMVTGQRIEEFTADYVGGLDEAPLWRGAPYRAVVDAERVAAERLELLGLVESYRRAKDRLGWVEFADGPGSNDRRTGTRGVDDAARAVPGTTAGRVPGHLQRTGHPADNLVQWPHGGRGAGPSGDSGR